MVNENHYSVLLKLVGYFPIFKDPGCNIRTISDSYNIHDVIDI